MPISYAEVREGPITRDFVMLDGLRGGKRARSSAAFEVRHDLRALFGDAVDGGAGFSFSPACHDLEHAGSSRFTCPRVSFSDVS